MYNRLSIAENHVKNVIAARMHGFRSELEWSLMNIFYFIEEGHKEAMTSEVVKALNTAYRNYGFYQ